jgi:hypothetical protein
VALRFGGNAYNINFGNAILRNLPDDLYITLQGLTPIGPSPKRGIEGRAAAETLAAASRVKPATPDIRSSVLKWRMGRDSNPRYLAVHTLSRRARSTALAPIRNEPTSLLSIDPCCNPFVMPRSP